MNYELQNNTKSANLIKNNLITSWSKLENTENIFRYKLRIEKQKILKEKFNFLVQLNPERTTLRRKPQTLSSIVIPFNPDDFNFNKINPEEHLFNINWKGVTISFLINNSPLTKYHCLLCPNLTENHPQILDSNLIRFSAAFLMILNDPKFKIGFNSCGAFASVNHLHSHLLYIEEKLYIEDAELIPVQDNFYKIKKGYPANGFCFVIGAYENIDQISDHIVQIVKYFCDRNIPHNLFFTLVNLKNKNVLKIFIFPRSKPSSVKGYTFFNTAFCELSGYVIVGDANVYESLTEESIVKKISDDIGDITDKLEGEIKIMFNKKS